MQNNEVVWSWYNFKVIEDKGIFCDWKVEEIKCYKELFTLDPVSNQYDNVFLRSDI